MSSPVHRHARDAVVPVEGEASPGRLEDAGGLGVGAALDEERGRVPLRGRHLAGDVPLPDDPVELRLVRFQVLGDLVGRAHRVGGADRLVGLLGGLVAAREEVGLLGQVGVAEGLADIRAGHLDGLAREVRRVGPHVGDQARGPLARDVHALVERLGGAHRALGAEAEPARRGLLQRARDVGGARPRAGPLGLDAPDRVGHARVREAPDAAPVVRRAPPVLVRGGDLDLSQARQLRDGADAAGQVGAGVVRLAALLRDVELLAPDLDELGPDRAVLAEPGVLVLDRRARGLPAPLRVDLGRGREELAPGGSQVRGFPLTEREAGGHLPPLVGHEGLDLLLAFDDQAHRDGLHPPGAEAAGDLLPEQRADLVAHDPVEDAPRLLGVHAVDIDRVGVAEGAGDLVLGDRGEDHALGVRGLDADLLGEVPRDRLALAVEVRREPDLAPGAHRVLRGALEVLDHRFLAAEHLVLGLEPLLDVPPAPDASHPWGSCWAGRGRARCSRGRHTRRPGTC
jgi:hypothetical protein